MADAGQVASFHRASRLHFLGTWRERFEQWQKAHGAGKEFLDPMVVQTLQKELASCQDPESDALWAHMDMDCFFVSAATRDVPGAAEVPAAVTSSTGATSSVCSANYAARRLGVTTELWSVERATAVLPSLKIIPVSEQLLRTVESIWQQVFQLLVIACGDDLQRVLMRSCDESVLHVVGMRPVPWAEALRKAVWSQTRCTCSVGLGPSQLVAKLAVKHCKPDGLKQVLLTEVEEFILPQPVSSLPQVGRALAFKLQEHGFQTCKDVRKHSVSQLKEWFGVKGEMLWSYAHGKDYGAVSQPQQRRTMSAEISFGVRVADQAAALRLLSEVVDQLASRLMSGGMPVVQLTLKLWIAALGWVEPGVNGALGKKGGHGACDHVTRSGMMERPSFERAPLLNCATRLLGEVSPDVLRIRGLGLSGKLAETPAKAGGLERWLQTPAKGSAKQPTTDLEMQTSIAESAGTPAKCSGLERWLHEPAEEAAKHSTTADCLARQTLVAEADADAPANCGGLQRWLQKSAKEDLAKPAIDASVPLTKRAPTAKACNLTQGASSTLLDTCIDLELSDEEQTYGLSEPSSHVGDRVQCPVCGSMQPTSAIEAHVNRHFDDVTPEREQSGEIAEIVRPHKRARQLSSTTRAGSNQELHNDCEIIV